jgi:hypothetical protein
LYANKTENAAASDNGTMLIGAQVRTDSTSPTLAEVIAIDDSNDTIQKFGYFVTQWISSRNILDRWQYFTAYFDKLLQSTDKLWVKYRIEEVDPTEATITWVNTTSFTTPTNVSAYEGYEVEVIEGVGSGKCSKISTVTGSGPYTVTLAETFTGATTTVSKARFQYWKEIHGTSDQTIQFIRLPVMEATRSIQFKVCMQFQGEDQFNGFSLSNAPHQK